MDSESETEGNQGRVGFGAEQYQCTARATLVQYTVYLMLNYCSCSARRIFRQEIVRYRVHKL